MDGTGGVVGGYSQDGFFVLRWSALIDDQCESGSSLAGFIICSTVGVPRVGGASLLESVAAFCQWRHLVRGA